MTVYNQSNTNILLAANTDDTVNGDDNVVSMGYPVTLAVNGYSNTIDGSYDTISLNDLSNVINGSGDKVTTANNSDDTVTGGGNTIAQSHGYLTISGANAWADRISGTVLELTVLDNSHLYLDDTLFNVYLKAAGSVVFATGDNTSFYGSDEKIHMSGATVGGDSIDGDHDRAFVAASSELTLTGNDAVVRSDDHSSLAITGTDDRLIGASFFATAANAAGVNTDVWIGGNGASGGADTLTASNITAEIGGNSNVILSGNDDTVTMHLDSNLYFVGNGLNMHVGNNTDTTISGKSESDPLDTISGANCTIAIATSANVELETYGANVTLASNVALTLERANNTIHAGNSDSIDILWGNTNQLILGQADVITDGGLGTTFQFGGSNGATTIKNFAADPGGVVDLLNGVGGYATSQAAVNALTSDGAGGLALSLGANGSIDFAGVSSLTAANFKIG